MPPSVECVRRALLGAGAGEPFEAEGVAAAVLIALRVDARGTARVVLTRRRDDLPLHAGEISFPGGKREAGDADLLATALRETSEELGLPPDRVEPLGALPPISTFVTNFAVHPFVGFVDSAVIWRPDPAEVSAVLEPRIAELRDSYRRRRMTVRGVSIYTETFMVDDDVIWGATGRLLKSALDHIAPCFE